MTFKGDYYRNEQTYYLRVNVVYITLYYLICYICEKRWTNIMSTFPIIVTGSGWLLLVR